MVMDSFCAYCSTKLEGRTDKKFCTPYCKSSYHYKKNSEKEDSMFQKIDRQLKMNRRVLKNFNKAGLATVRKERLQKEGFLANYFTHYWKNNKGQVYLFCYEYGFLDLGNKYVLIEWQGYMETP